MNRINRIEMNYNKKSCPSCSSLLNNLFPVWLKTVPLGGYLKSRSVKKREKLGNHENRFTTEFTENTERMD